MISMFFLSSLAEGEVCVCVCVCRCVGMWVGVRVRVSVCVFFELGVSSNLHNALQARIQGFFLGVLGNPPYTAVCNILFIFKPTDVNFPLPFKFHCRIQST